MRALANCEDRRTSVLRRTIEGVEIDNLDVENNIRALVSCVVL